MIISILGRQPALGIGELERVFGAGMTNRYSPSTALITVDSADVRTLGGSLKLGTVIERFDRGTYRDISRAIVQYYSTTWRQFDGKITLGISLYDDTAEARDVQKTGLLIKQALKKHNVSLRLVPNAEPALSTAVSHNNKLGLSANKVEIIVVRGNTGGYVVAESLGAQNITAYAKRDQQRPKRDAFVGMLPPKLAQIMVNLAPKSTVHTGNSINILDSFCGTGTVLQEAALMTNARYELFGSDLNERMVQYTIENLGWLQRNFTTTGTMRTISQADATNARWPEAPNVDVIVSEAYLGQPFSAPPSPAKLREVVTTCNGIIGSFLKNIGGQIKPGTGLCLAVPAWRAADGSFTHLPLISTLGSLGYTVVGFKNIRPEDLLYFRDNQVVARELLVLVKT